MTKIIEISVHLFEFVLVRRSHLDVVLFDYLYQSFGEGGVVGKGYGETVVRRMSDQVRGVPW